MPDGHAVDVILASLTLQDAGPNSTDVVETTNMPEHPPPDAVDRSERVAALLAQWKQNKVQSEASTVATTPLVASRTDAAMSTKTAEDYHWSGVYCEALVPFRVGCDTIEAEQEATLETVVAAMSMREGLRLQLIGGGDDYDLVGAKVIEDSEVTARRLRNVRSFFALQNVRSTAMGASNASWVRPQRSL